MKNILKWFKNRKGFSLIELLATLTIISIITIIIAAVVKYDLFSTEKRIDQALTINIKNAGTLYSNEFTKEINWKIDEFENKVACVNIQTLIDKGYIKSNTKVENIKENYIIKAVEKGGVLIVELVESNMCDTSALNDPKKDTTMPEIKSITLTPDVTTIDVNVVAEDRESGIKTYYYSIDNQNFIPSSSSIYTFENLNMDTKYQVYVYVDNNNNLKSFTKNEETKTLIPKSTLVINPNGGSWENSTLKQTFTGIINDKKEIPIPTRENHIFTGWTRTNTYGTITSLTESTTYTFGSANGVTDTLTASWELSTATLKINPNGGSWGGTTAITTKTQNINTQLAIPVPTRAGYVFTGWTRTNTYGTMTSLTSVATYTYGSTSGVTDTLTANWQIAVAQIGSVYYTSLQNAINAVPANNVSTSVILLINTTETITIPVNKRIVLNLNYKTITGTLTNSGYLTVQSGTIYNGNGIAVNNYGTLITSGITFTAVNGHAIKNMGTGTINIVSSTLKANWATVVNESTSNLTFTNTSIQSDANNGVYHSTTSTVTYTGGSITTGVNGGLAGSGINLRSTGKAIVNTTINSGGHAIQLVSGASVTVNGGTYSAIFSSIYADNQAIININGGTFSKISVSSPIFTMTNGTISSSNDRALYDSGGSGTARYNIYGGSIISTYESAMLIQTGNVVFDITGGYIEGDYTGISIGYGGTLTLRNATIVGGSGGGISGREGYSYNIKLYSGTVKSKSDYAMGCWCLTWYGCCGQVAYTNYGAAIINGT